MNDKPATRRPRFSLLTLLLVLTTVAAVAGMVVVYGRLKLQEQEFADMRAENLRLREEQGALTIANPTKIHAIRMRERHPRTWSYRVWLPPGRDYVVASQINDLPGSAASPAFGGRNLLVDRRTIVSSRPRQTGMRLAPGEHVVTLAVVEEGAHAWLAELEVRPADSGPSGGAKTGGPHLHPAVDEWPEREDFYGTGGITEHQTIADPARTLILLDYRVGHNQPGGGGSTADATEGAMLWIEPVGKPSAPSSPGE